MKRKLLTRKILINYFHKYAVLFMMQHQYFKNELVNKHRISASIHTAKKITLKHLANNWDKENLGFEEAKFPPEKTIYLSLTKRKRYFSYSRKCFDVITIDKHSVSINFGERQKIFESAKSEQRKISEFVRFT
jgi:hypothetical protein